MKILFLHPNFPAQFKHIATAFGDLNHDVQFLCQTHYGRTLPNVSRVTLKNRAGHEFLESKSTSLIERSQILGNQYRDGFLYFKEKGWTPDVIISHSGWGCGLHAKEIWPKAKLISYLEWWFCPESDFFHYDLANKHIGISQDSIKKSWLRNQQVALELSTSDEIVTPTYWQRNQLPQTLRKSCHVIFDGVDIEKFSPRKRTISKINDNFILTYGTRGLDPMRCFPQFIEEIPVILEKFPQIRIEIAGEDRSYYGNPTVDNSKSWGTWAKEFLKSHQLEEKVHWYSRMPFDRYREWIHRSNCHVYLTHPFVPSWSLVETYCTNVPIITSDIEATREICGDGPYISYIDHRNKGFLLEGLRDLMRESEAPSASPRDRARFDVGMAVRAWGLVAGLNLTTRH